MMRDGTAKRLLALGIATFLGACAATITPTTTPDGRAAYAIECKGAPDKCQQAAAETCPDGFDTLDAGASDGGAILVHCRGDGGAMSEHQRYVCSQSPLMRTNGDLGTSCPNDLRDDDDGGTADAGRRGAVHR